MFSKVGLVGTILALLLGMQLVEENMTIGLLLKR
jgi:hypothetical protein